MAKSPHNAEYTRQYNRRLILKLLLRQPMSRAELARKTGLTRASITILADAMMEEGLIRETAPVNTDRGRSPVPLALCPQALQAFGLFINRSVMRLGLVDLCGECTPLMEEKIVPKKKENVQKMLERIAAKIRETMEERPELAEHMAGIGISCPGPLDLEEGRILNPPGFEAWHHFPICQWMTENTGLPAAAWDNADALAMYNCYYGEKDREENFLLLLVDTGIGSGIIRKDRIYHGAGKVSPELGHISICFDGRRCGCGNRGCLERYASIPSLLENSRFREWKDVIADLSAENRELSSFQGSKSLILLSQGGEGGQPEDGREIVRREAVYLATAIRTAATLFDLHTVYLAGDILKGFEVLADQIRQELRDRSAGGEGEDAAENAFILRPSDTSADFETIAAASVVFSGYLE